MEVLRPSAYAKCVFVIGSKCGELYVAIDNG